jgi:hypothetical protein
MEPFYKVTYKDLLIITCCEEPHGIMVTAYLMGNPIDEAIPYGQEFFGERIGACWGITYGSDKRYNDRYFANSHEAAARAFASTHEAVAYADEQLAVFKRIIEGEPKKIIHEAGACLKCGSLVDMAILHICEPCDPAPSTVDAILSEREKTHGDYAKTMELFREMTRAFERAFSGDSDFRSPPNDVIEYRRRDRSIAVSTAQMICMKLARIACGDPTFVDHWDDIGGYAKLMADLLREKAK